MEYIIISLLSLSVILLIVIIFLLSKGKGSDKLENEIRLSRQETINTVSGISNALSANQKSFNEMQDRRLLEIKDSLSGALSKADRDIEDGLRRNSQNLADIRETLDSKITALQAENTKQLNEMRHVVDEKLQSTLEERISHSFKTVSERLEEVYKGLGEMQALATNVGDLKKVMSNVKTRGILGEIQLGAILEDILTPDQYEKNIPTVAGSSNPVEYAVKLPGSGSGYVYLPIDSKFPADSYIQLNDAYEGADPVQIQSCKTEFVARIKQFAKDISTKYVSAPDTTDFGIMFLPTEGLYAEVIRLGLIEILQRDYKIVIAGPTTMAVILNSLQMGFRTLALQKRSSEVWDVLGAVKTEFDKFEEVLNATQQRLEAANKELDKLVGTRTRQIKRKLKDVTSLSDAESLKILNDVE